MAENPIRYQDLISPDDSIEKLIGQLEQLQKTYTGMAQSVRDQAAGVAASLRSVSGATASGQQATKDASREADRLAKAYRDLDFACSDTAKRVAELKEIQKEQNMMNKLSAQSARAVEGSYNALSAQYRINKMLINNLTQAERENDPAAKKLIEDTRRIYDEMNKMQQATGKFALNVGNYEQSITNAIGINTQWYKGIQELGALFEGGFSKGVATAGNAVAAFGKKLLALMMNPVVATIAAITAAFMALAKGISTSEENTNALMRILAPFQRILTGVVDVLQTMATWLLKGVEGMEKLAMGASRLMERLPLVGNAIKKVNAALQENINLTIAKQNLDKAERANSAKQATLARNVAKWRRDAEMTNDPQRRIKLLRMANAAEEQMMYNEIALAKEDLRIKEAQARMSQNDKQANDELAQARVRLMKAEENYYQRTTRLQSKIRNINNKGGGTGGGSEVNQKKNEADELLRIQKQKNQRELDVMRKAEDAKVALMENEYDRQRAQAILNYDRQIEDAKAAQAELGEDEVETKKYYDDLIVALEQQKWNKLAAIAEKEMKDAVDRETKDAQERVKKADDLAKKKKDDKGKRLDMYDLLGLKLDDEQKAAIDESVQYAIDSVNMFMDAYVAAAEKKRELADREVESAQRVLEMEIEARNNGYANEVELARKELETAKKNQRKALEEERKAQQAKEAIDTATQVSSLITATANIWQAYSSLPFVGQALAIAATALMWGAFAAAKVKAFQVAGSGGGSEAYGEGTVELLQGGSHQSGNDIDLGRKSNGVRRRAEGGEFFAVINKRNSRRYRGVIPDVVNSLNDGTFAEKYMNAYNGGDFIVQEERRQDLSGLQRDVRMIREQGENEQFIDGNGNTVMKYKNLIRIVRR